MMVKKFFIFLCVFFLCWEVQGATFYTWRYREHATDCTALTDGKPRDLCFEVDDEAFYKCEPDAGDCSGSEWKSIADNLGDHLATQNLDIGSFDIESVGGITANEGTVTIANVGVITISNDDIVSSTGDINFDNKNLVTTGSITIDSDSSKIYLGDGQDASIYFDGSDLNINSENITAADEVHITNFDVLDLSAADITTIGDITANALSIQNTTEPAITISMTSITGTDNQAIDIVGGEALDASEDWTGLRIKPDDLDPSGDNTRIRGIALNMGGVDTTNTPDSLIGLRIKMPTGLTGIVRAATDAIYIEEGDIDHNFAVPSTAGSTFTAYDMVINSENLHANSKIHGINFSTANGAPSGSVAAIGTHTYVAPIHQHIGSYTSPSQTEYAGKKHTGGTVWADGIDASEIFVVNSDEIYVGSASQFSEIEVTMTTDATRSVAPTFWYNTAADAWTEFSPSDATDGFQQSGLVHWTLGDISASWTNDGDPGGANASTGYWIKMIRTSPPDPGTPTPTTVKTGTVVLYSWDKDGDVDVLSMEADTLTEGGNAVYNSTETPGGELGGTWASPTIDDNVTVTGWTLGTSTATSLSSPTIISSTGSINFVDETLVTTGSISIDSDSSRLYLGDGQDASIYYDGTDIHYDSQVVGSGDHIFDGGDIKTAGAYYGDGSHLSGVSVSPAGSDTQVQYNNGGSFGGITELLYNDSTGTLALQGELITSNSITFHDDISADFGTDGDASIYYDTTESTLVIKNDSGADVLFSHSGAEFRGTGSSTFNSITIHSDDIKSSFGTDSDASIYYDSTESGLMMTTTGTFKYINNCFILQSPDSSFSQCCVDDSDAWSCIGL